MTLQEAKSAITEIVEASKDYQSSVNALQSKIIAFSDEVNSVFSSVGHNIGENTIVEYSNRNATQIISSLSETLEVTRSALSTLNNDANKKIREIVDSYNTYNNSLEKEKRGPSLECAEIALSSVGGAIASYSPVSINTNVTSGSSTSSNNSSGTSTYTRSNGSGGSGYSNVTYNGNNNSNVDNSFYNENSDSNSKKSKNKNKNTNKEDSTISGNSSSTGEEDELDYYLSLLNTKGVESKEIDNWDEIVDKYLNEKELEEYIDGIELKGDTVRCVLANDKRYKISKIKNKNSLTRAISKILEKESSKG